MKLTCRARPFVRSSFFHFFKKLHFKSVQVSFVNYSKLSITTNSDLQKFQFCREIWIQVLVILLQLYLLDIREDEWNGVQPRPLPPPWSARSFRRQCWSKPRQPQRALYWSPVGQVRIRSKRPPILELKIFKNQLWHGFVKGSFFRSYCGAIYLVNFSKYFYCPRTCLWTSRKPGKGNKNVWVGTIK